MRSRHTPATATFAAALAVVTTVGVGIYTASSGLASTATFSKTLAGPSIAPMYPSGLIWDPGPCAGGSPTCIVVADTGYNRVTVFNPASSTPSVPVLTIGSLGALNGQFNTPRDVAVDTTVGPNKGDIYVADAANSRIQAFSPTGTWLWTSGVIGVGSCAKPATGTTAPCAVNEPLGISFDATDNEVLVADTGHSEIKAYDVNGNYLWESPKGILASPREARRGPDGEIWVADYHNEEIKAFAVPSGQAWASTVTTPNIILGDGLQGGHGNGEINSPYNVAFSPDGTYAYVADTGNERIAVWNISMSPASPPVWIENIGARCPTTCPEPPGNAACFNAIRRVTVDPATGDLWAADFWGSGLHEFAPLPEGSGALTSPPSPSSPPSPITCASTQPDAAIGEIDGSAAPPPGFAEAYSVAVGSNGATYAVDRLNQRVEQFTAAGAYVDDTGARGVAVGKFSWPEAVAVAPNGMVWVGDTRNGRLQEFNPKLVGTPKPVAFGETGTAVGQFDYIEGVAVAANGIVWAADTKNDRIQSYNPTTGVFTAYGTKGSGPGQFNLPEGVAVSATDIYVADTNNNRIEELDLNGNYIGSYTGLDQPQGIALAPDGTLWVANTGTTQTDTHGNDIVQLSSTLALLSTFGGPGTGNTQFYEPHSLAVNGSTLFVADTYNNRVQEFTISG
jgi:DNA-binding beta-propeller fold protein YncE